MASPHIPAIEKMYRGRERACLSLRSPLRAGPGLCYNPAAAPGRSFVSPHEGPPSMSPPPKARRGPWTFVALFALCAVGLLGGYRYAIDTIANDY
jgi:hypothetical protein